MGDSATANEPTVFETFGKWVWKCLGRFVGIPAVQAIAVLSSWAGMFAACVLLSHGEIDRAMLFGVIVIILRVFPPWHRSIVLVFDPFFVILPSWGMIITAHRADTEAAVLSYRIAGIVSIVIVVGWGLFRDYCRFRYPYWTRPAA